MNPHHETSNNLHSQSPNVPSTEFIVSDDKIHRSYLDIVYDEASEEERQLYLGDYELSVTVEKTLTLTDVKSDILVHKYLLFLIFVEYLS